MSTRDFGTGINRQPEAVEEQHLVSAATPSLNLVCSVLVSPELQISTRREIDALGLQLVQMNIESSSKDDLGHASPGKSTNASEDEAQKRSSKHDRWHGQCQISVNLHQGMK